MKRALCRSLSLFCLALLALPGALHCLQPAPAAAMPPIWKQLMPRKRVAADPEADYGLTQSHGPWLIMATSFDGPEGEREARDLVLDLRQNHNLPAFYYAMTFQLDDERPGRGLDAYGGPIKRRYRRGSEVLQHAVLVGEFPSIDDIDAQEQLEVIKFLQPQTLQVKEGESSAQSLAGVRKFYNKVKEQAGRKVVKGPLGHAFLTRNPLLPREYFTPDGVEPEVAQWNRGLEFSLMNCPGKYSVRVATFRGRTMLEDSRHADHGELKDSPSGRRRSTCRCRPKGP